MDACSSGFIFGYLWLYSLRRDGDAADMADLGYLARTVVSRPVYTYTRLYMTPARCFRL